MTKLDPNRGSGEDRLIAKYLRPLAQHPGAFGLIDDAAVLIPPAGHDLVLTTDGVIAGVHVFAGDPANAIARRALRVNLSDLAAKGAKPAGFLMSLALPADVSDEWLAAFAAGLGDDARQYGCPLLGGDTDRTPGPLSVSIAAFGTLPSGTMVRRTGAKAGDLVFVSGTIGDAALGLALRRDPATAARLTATARDHLLARYQLPQPRTMLAEALRGHASGAIDISDGLVADLAKLCRASGASARIEVERIPLSDGARAMCDADAEALRTVLTGGDDYEILATVAPANAEAFRAAALAAGAALASIGCIEAGDAAPRLLRDGQALQFDRMGYSHF